MAAAIPDIKISDTEIPPRLSLEVTSHCNSRCRHCFVRSDRPAPAALNGALAQTILAEGYDIGFRHLHITGGEPLLWEPLYGTLDFAFSRGYETVFLNTNGTLLAAGTARRLADFSGLSVSVSIEGNRRFHDAMRGAGAYQRAVSGVENALSVGLDTVIFTSVCKQILPHLPDAVDGLYRRFPDMAYLTLIRLIPLKADAMALAGELLGPAEFVRWVKMVCMLNLYGLRSVLLNEPLANVVSQKLGMPWLPKAFPLHRKGSVFVTADRLITLSHFCREHFGAYVPGAIGHVLASGAYDRAFAPDENACAPCPYLSLCRSFDLKSPLPSDAYGGGEMPFCRQVLDGVAGCHRN